MKKLKKLTIVPEKLMKNDELINLRGGYGEYDPHKQGGACCACSLNGAIVGAIAGSNASDCGSDCRIVHGDSTSGSWDATSSNCNGY